MPTLILAAAIVLMTQPASATDLADLRWRHRLVVVTTADATATQRGEQARDRAGWHERQLVLIELTDAEATVDGETSGVGSATARKTLGMDGEAPVALVGLDGGVKQRRDDAFTNAELFAAVDAMPMRRNP